jgi:hypothetical protein
MSSTPVNFVFLCLKEHPYAREMLAQLLSHGHVPSLIVEETSAVADTERQKFLDRIAGFTVRAIPAASLPPTALHATGLPHHYRAAGSVGYTGYAR